VADGWRADLTAANNVLAHVPEAASVVVTRPGEASTEPGGQYNTIRVAHTLVGSTVTIGDALGGIVSYQYTAATSKVKIRSYLGTSTQTAGHADQPVPHAVDKCPPGARRGLPDL
jgi:hypothetical protein